MWRHEDLFFGAMAGAGGGGPPIRTPEEIAERCREPRARCVPDLPLHARHRALDGVQHAVHGRHASSSRRNTISIPLALWQLVERGASQLHRHRRRRVRATAARCARDTDAGRALDVTCLQRRALRRRDPLAVAEARVRRTVAGSARRRRLRRVRDGRSGPVGRRGRRRRAERAPLPGRSTTPRCWATICGPSASGVVGRLAPARPHPARLLQGPRRRPPRPFPVVDGVRWAVPGDHAVVEADGSITLLGRGSVSINTGGEKVYPEEVESVLKGHADVFDAVVVGVPDDRWGERVVAIVQARAGTTPALETLQQPQPRPSRGLQGAARAGRRRRDRTVAVGQARLPLGPCRRNRARRVRSRRDREPAGRRDEPVPPPARRQPGRLDALGRRSVRACAREREFRCSSRSGTRRVTGVT